MRIEVNQLPPASSSPNARVHWAQRKRDTDSYAKAVFYECLQVRNTLVVGNCFRPFRKPILSLTFVFRDHRQRDEDNLRARFKAGQDVLVHAGLIAEDDMQHLKVNQPRIVVDSKRAPLTIIELKENSRYCTHFWKIDSNQVGICRYCETRKDFTLQGVR